MQTALNSSVINSHSIKIFSNEFRVLDRQSSLLCQAVPPTEWSHLRLSVCESGSRGDLSGQQTTIEDLNNTFFIP